MSSDYIEMLSGLIREALNHPSEDDRTKEKAAKTKDKADATSRAAEKIQQDS